MKRLLILAVLLAGMAVPTVARAQPVAAATPTAVCSIQNPDTPQARFQVNGTGYVPGRVYRATVTFPASEGGTTSRVGYQSFHGEFFFTTAAQWSGTYSIVIFRHRGQTLASCSATQT